MATTKDSSKGIECPMFSGKEEDYHVWVTKFDTYSMVKGFYKIMDGTEVPANELRRKLIVLVDGRTW